MWVLTSCSAYSKSASRARKGATFSSTPVLRLSMQTTLQPSERSLSQRWLPMKPAPPVTSALASVIATSESPVKEPCFLRGGRIEGVTAVHDELWLAHQRGGPGWIQPPYLFPLGDYHGRVGPSQCLVWVEDGLDVRDEL